jgi:putative Ca2+/H+ antiporter (TMEM165/GDT1 family)
VSLEALAVSAGIVAIAEIGDKTQLLALVLATRFKRPWPIVAGILAATLLNHAAAGAVGAWLLHFVGAERMRWILAVSFLVMAAWTLVPDKLEERDEKTRPGGVFWTTAVLFFLVEMGDKTQLATVALAARFDSLVAVVAGTTLGMLLADVPVVWLGESIMRRVPLKAVRIVAALLFVAMGIAVVAT